MYKKVIIIGGGAAGLMAADVLGEHVEVHIFEKSKTLGRKFLVAGKGGFNLSNNKTGKELAQYYSPSGFMNEALERFNSSDTRTWLKELGIPTFIGSSGRIFPEKGIKPAEVLNKLTSSLRKKNIHIHLCHEFTGFSSQQEVVFKTQGAPDEKIICKADYYILALGGASWPKTGSDGNWATLFQQLGISTLPFQASNCGINIAWPATFAKQWEGRALKNIQISVENFTLRGEALITSYGIEGNAIYPCIPYLREKLNQKEPVYLVIDLKPDISLKQLQEKISRERILPKNYAYAFNLSKCVLQLIKTFTTKEEYLDQVVFIKQLKQIQIPVLGLRPVAEAISTVGGIATTELNTDFSLKKYPHIYCIGEMVNWDAPTGGFLLQGCFSMAQFVATALIKKLTY